MDDEVGDGRLHLQGRRRGDGAAADMNLYAHIVHLGHVTDLLCLGDASRVAQVGLNDIQRPVLKDWRKPQRV